MKKKGTDKIKGLLTYSKNAGEFADYCRRNMLSGEFTGPGYYAIDLPTRTIRYDGENLDAWRTR